ncbi:MAG: universal stress protein [Bacteroidales bacterium]
MKLNNIILVPTDFSEVCHNAIDHAVKIAESQKDLRVCIYHVIDKNTQAYFKDVQSLNQAVEDKLRGLINEFQLKHEVEMEYAYEEGNIFELIHQKAKEIGANYIILGTHGKKGWQHLFGSYALKVLTKAQVPTLIIQNRKFMGYKNVLIPVNSFTEARKKVGIACRMAKRYGSKMHIYKEIVSDQDEMNRINIITAQIAEEFRKEKVPFDIEISEGKNDSVKGLIYHAAAKDIDLIMILTEPQIGTSYFNLGPWNEKIMFNEAQIPVLCINPVEHSKIFFSM